MTLSDFLLARIAEDEKDARVCRGPEWSFVDHTEPKWGADDGEVELLGGGKPLATFTDYGRNVEPYHVTRWDPARVLAECEAKRRIVDTCETMQLRANPTRWQPAEEILQLLALPYADHPDYREEWKP